MPTESLFFDPLDPELKIKIEGLAKVPGICIFVDITGSMNMKSRGLKHWAVMIHNCFANARTYLPTDFSPVRAIGDALMFYIQESELKQSGYTCMQVYDGLWQFVRDRGSDFPEVKVGAVWCEDAYPLTFFRGGRDYYGLDIDLAARLQAKASSREIVIDQRFRDRVMADAAGAGNRDQFVSVALIGTRTGGSERAGQ